MAELVDALDSKSSSFGSVGSIPTRGTTKVQSFFIVNLFLLGNAWVKQYTLTVTSVEGGTVSSEEGTYDEGTEVTITVSANEGFRFSVWEGNDSTSENQAITLNSNQTYPVLFELLPIDSDGDGIIESKDYRPCDPFLTYDDWEESKDEYSELFYTSDI